MCRDVMCGLLKASAFIVPMLLAITIVASIASQAFRATMVAVIVPVLRGLLVGFPWVTGTIAVVLFLLSIGVGLWSAAQQVCKQTGEKV